MGPLIILSGPSGSGKSTLIARLLAERTWPMRLSVSVTTRPPRKGEQDGVHYHYWTRERFRDEIERQGFLEWAEVFGNYYGTLKEEVEPYRRKGVGVLLDIDVNGWKQVKEHCPEAVSSSRMATAPMKVLLRGAPTMAVRPLSARAEPNALPRTASRLESRPAAVATPVAGSSR